MKKEGFPFIKAESYRRHQSLDVQIIRNFQNWNASYSIWIHHNLSPLPQLTQRKSFKQTTLHEQLRPHMLN